MSWSRRGMVGTAVLTFWVAFGACNQSAHAQVAPRPLPGAVEPGRERPLPSPPTQPEFDFTIESPGRSQVPRSVQELRFTLNDIHVVGSQVFPVEHFRTLYQGLIGREITISNILDVADAIEDEYRRAGYILTHAFPPPQRVKDGVFTINVVEGYVSGISLEGGDPAIQDTVRGYLAPVLASRPLLLATIERSLLLVNDIPGVGASGLLRPSPNVLGAADLLVTIVESSFAGGFSVNNRDSEFTDRWLMTGDGAVNSVVLPGDQILLTVASARQALEKLVGQARYRMLLGSSGLNASFSATAAHSEPAGGGLADVHLVTDSYAFGPRLNYPILRSRAASLALDAGFTAQDAKAREPGVLVSHDQWRVADVSLSFTGTTVAGDTGASLDLAQGLGVFGATTNGTTENGVTVLSRSGGTTGNPEFTKLTASLHQVRQIVGSLSLALTVQAQYGFAPLLAGEQIAFGGAQIGRGYDPAAITGDHGLGGAMELHYDIQIGEYQVLALQPYIFYDTAKVWAFHGGGAPALSVAATGVVGTGSGLAIASTGLGTRVFLTHNITGGVEYAHTLERVPGSNAGRLNSQFLFDAGINF